MKVVVKLQPFVLKQNLFTISDEGKTLDSVSVSLSELNKTVFGFVGKYSINQIDLVGPKSFAKGIRTELLKDNAEKYGNQKITINII